MTRPIPISERAQRPQRAISDSSLRRNPKPTTQRPCGPHAQTVDDLIHSPPNFAYFLNTYVQPTRASQLGIGCQDCCGCHKHMCDEIHIPLPCSPYQPTPLVLPTQNPGRIQCLPNRKPVKQWLNGPDAPSTRDVCPDRTNCEVAVKITTPGCGHIFGSRCLAGWLTFARANCPICGTVWYVDKEPAERPSVMREAWPWRVKVPVSGDWEWLLM